MPAWTGMGCQPRSFLSRQCDEPRMARKLTYIRPPPPWLPNEKAAGGLLADEPPTKPPPPWPTGPHTKAAGGPLAEIPYGPTDYKAMGGPLSTVSPTKVLLW